MDDTIYALSSGGLPGGVAVLRISGPQSRVVIETMCTGHEFGSPVFLSSIYNPNNQRLLDKGIVLTFIGPKSFTGEDVVELHVHGGVAVVDSILDALSGLKGFRAAEAGEFTYRAFANNKLDLTQAEGIADLISSESEAQRRLALDSVEGVTQEVVHKWSTQLLKMRALIEAEIDFVDEEDIPGSVSERVWDQASELVDQMDAYLQAGKCGEVVREGYHVVLLGKPNAGKSTLLNCLAKRNVAIVSDEPGTTRDTIEVKLNLDGQIVYVSDTAGIRKTASNIEMEGVRRAKVAASRADMTIWLHAVDDGSPPGGEAIDPDLLLLTKDELRNSTGIAGDHTASVFENRGIDELMDIVKQRAKHASGDGGIMHFGRARQRNLLLEARQSVDIACQKVLEPIELRAEYLRNAAGFLGKIVGQHDNEDILAEIFSEFCVGK